MELPLNNELVLKSSVVAVALAVASIQPVRAQQTDTSSTPSVYITGSNLKRTAKEGTAPVQVITIKDIRDTGAATVTELMRLVPAMGSDQNLDTNDGSFSRGVSTASLRGLSSSATLILLNGRRMTPAAYADPNDGNSTMYDLNAIPLSALDRVEIMKDGASAVYGSDAVGGVINFITKNNYRGLEVAVRASANDDGEFRRKGTNFFWGKGDVDADGYNFFLTADISNRDRVLRADVKDIEFEKYKFLNNRYATPYGSTVSAYPAFYRESVPGSANFAVNRSTMASRLIVNTNCDPARLLTGATNMGLPATSVFVGRQFCNYDTNQFLEGAAAGKDTSVMARGVLKLSGSLKAFAEAAFTRSQRDYTGSPITLGQAATTNFSSDAVVEPFQAILGIGHPDNPFPTARSSIGYRFENLRGGTQTINRNTRLLTGIQGTTAGWDWESALLYNLSERDDTTYGRLFLPTLRRLNTGTSLAQLAADPTLSHDVLNKNEASILHLDAKANTQFGQLAGGAMGLAMGVEVRREKLKMTPDPLLGTGQIFGLANSAIDGQRDVKSAFVELRTPFLKNFEMDFAGRFDKYPGIKTNFVPKIGAKWDVTGSFAVRGTYARGFRAPALNQVTPGGSQFFSPGNVDPRRCEDDDQTPKPGATEVDCNKTAAGVGNSNPDLIPEKSKSFSLGFLYAPTSSLDFGVDI
jgi:iron complex outermembrane recepter protein